ncbi:ComEA family DNA-binding protein [Microbacterium aureliae]
MGAAVVLVLAALAVTVGIGLVRSAVAPVEEVAVDPPGAVSSGTPTPSAPAAERVYVHVSGAVRREGLYVLAPGARVVDAIAAAGGYADGADRAAVNLARAVVDGEQLHVPVPGEAPAAGGAGAGDGATAGGPVDLNTADAGALETLPRIGPALAERIIDWRTRNGGFRSVDDLLAVPGIGETILEGLRDLVRV